MKVAPKVAPMAVAAMPMAVTVSRVRSASGAAATVATVIAVTVIGEVVAAVASVVAGTVTVIGAAAVAEVGTVAVAIGTVTAARPSAAIATAVPAAAARAVRNRPRPHRLVHASVRDVTLIGRVAAAPAVGPLCAATAPPTLSKSYTCGGRVPPAS